MFYNALVKFRDEQLENYQGQALDYSASDYHHISKTGARTRRGRNQNTGSSSKRRTHLSIVKDLHSRMSFTQEPKSSASVESYDPFRSPKTHNVATEAKYAQITVHRYGEPETTMAEDASPIVKPPPSIAEEVEPEDENENSEYTVLQKRKHKPNSVKSFHSSKVPLSSSKARGLSTRSTSYRRNVSFHHARNRSQGSTKPKKRKIVPNRRSDLKRSPSACSLQMIADSMVGPEIPSSPPLPAQPTVVRQGGMTVKSLGQTRKIRAPDFIWKEDARKVSNELGQICEEAFNGSSVTTIRTTSTGTDVGYETPATPVSMGSPGEPQHANSNVKPVSIMTKDSNKPHSIEVLTETRRKLVEHSKGRNDNIPTYLSGVIGHLDRLIEEDQAQRRDQSSNDHERSSADPFISIAHENSLPAITEEFASPVRGPDDMNSKLKSKLRGTNRHDAKNTIRMVPHSSLRSMEEVKPLIIRKKNQGDDNVDNVFNSTASRNISTNSGQGRNPCNLAPIDEVPGSPTKGEKLHDNKKWSWFKHRSQLSDPAPCSPPKENQARVPSNDTVVVHSPQEPQSPIKKDNERIPTRKSSMERFKGGFLKLMPKKGNKTTSTPPPGPGMFKMAGCFFVPLIQIQDPQKDHPRPDLLCKGIPDADSSFEAQDPNSPFTNKRHSLASQNWFARMFQIKPACRIIALNTSKVRSRKEVYQILRGWEDLGMEDVKMDKGNSIIRGRVGEVNCKFTSVSYYSSAPMLY